MNWQDVIEFWFQELNKKDWFASRVELDDKIRQRFLTVHHAASRGEVGFWREDPEGRLAEIIVLDQFSRNIFRDSAQAFACDGMALVLAQEAIAAGVDERIPSEQRSFLYMPFMHSESKTIHEIAVRLFSARGLEDNLRFEMRHKAIIDRFGRFPHRNEALGRESTTEEIAFLKTPGSSF